MIRNNNKRGFTLVEMLVVIAVLGIIAGIGIGKYTGFLEISKFKTDMVALEQLNYMMNNFYDLQEIYPSQAGKVSGVSMTQQEVMNYFVDTFYGDEGIEVKANYGQLVHYLRDNYPIAQTNFVGVGDCFIYLDDDGHDEYFFFVDEAGFVSISYDKDHAFVSPGGVKASLISRVN